MGEVYFLQQDYIVGHLHHNQKIIIEGCAAAARADARVVITPELSLTGYIPEDGLYSPSLYDRVQQSLDVICAAISPAITLLVGLPIKQDDKIYNAVALIQNNQVAAVYKKVKLPNSSVFDEGRYFTPSDNPPLIFYGEETVFAVQICEDLWHKEQVEWLRANNVKNILAINGSPFYVGKQHLREQTMAAIGKELNATVYYINGVGGQDELVFDGASFVMSSTGALIGRLPAFAAENGFATTVQAYPDKYESIYTALVASLRAYVYKAGFKNGVVLGLSGGVDSALVATVAVDALGAKNVHSVMLSTQYTSKKSRDAAALLANNLSIQHSALPINSITEACHAAIDSLLVDKKGDVTAENIQARTRGLLLMALANNANRLLLTTGNKTELACGYATLYGDMCGGFAPIKDLLKTEVWQLCRYINQQAGKERIPVSIIEAAPTAELRANQTDQDSLPPYDVLDEMVSVYLAYGRPSDLVNRYDADVCHDVYRRLCQSEFKRQQAPIGTKVSHTALGKDWRMPIANALFDDKP